MPQIVVLQAVAEARNMTIVADGLMTRQHAPQILA
jgi:hypothetical protein